MPLAGARAFSAAHEWCAVVAFKRQSSNAQKGMRECSSPGVLFVAVRPLNVYSSARRADATGAPHPSGVGEKNVSGSTLASDARIAVRGLVFLGLWPLDAGPVSVDIGQLSDIGT